jgi:hypothetical protein
MAGLEHEVRELTLEVRELVAQLRERCPAHASRIDTLERRLWGAMVAALMALMGAAVDFVVRR